MDALIHNRDALALTTLRADALAIAEAGYAAINIDAAVKRKIRIENNQLHIEDTVYPLADRKIFFVGVGKCALSGGRAIEALLGDALAGGIILDVAPPDQEHSSKVDIFVGTHPLPSEANAQASQRILEFLAGREESDLIIMLISGGGSALLSLPEAPMTSSGESTLFEALTGKGAPIQDMNIVRKHISRARGGALAVAAYPAEVVSLIVSDVPGDDIRSISSGPTVLDTSTVADAQAVLKRYGIGDVEIVFIESEKDEKYFTRVSNTLFLSSQDALVVMKEAAAQRGYAARIVDARFTGEARDIGHAISEELHGSAAKTALLYAGESTVTLGDSEGKGGRNQEMALAALPSLGEGEIILPFASDGHDNTEHAGAIADDLTRTHAEAKNIAAEEYLNAHNSYEFFATVGDALITDPLESNVSDLVVALKAG